MRPCDDRHGDHRGPGLFQYFGSLAASRAGSEHIIDQQNPPAANLPGKTDLKRAVNIAKSLTRLQIRLSARSFTSFETITINGDFEDIGQRLGDEIRAVRPTSKAMPPIHGNRNDQIGIEILQYLPSLACQQFTEGKRQRFAGRKFHLRNDVLQMGVIIPQCHDIFEMKRCTGTGYTPFLGVCLPLDKSPASQAKCPNWGNQSLLAIFAQIDRPFGLPEFRFAIGTMRRIQQIDAPLGDFRKLPFYSPNPRHGGEILRGFPYSQWANAELTS
jgi:hypothetical protein